MQWSSVAVTKCHPKNCLVPPGNQLSTAKSPHWTCDAGWPSSWHALPGFQFDPRQAIHNEPNVFHQQNCWSLLKSKIIEICSKLETKRILCTIVAHLQFSNFMSSFFTPSLFQPTSPWFSTHLRLHGNGPAAGAVAARKDQGLDGTVDFGQRDLQGHLQTATS